MLHYMSLCNNKQITTTAPVLCCVFTFLWRKHISILSCNVMFRWQFVIFPLFASFFFLLSVLLFYTMI